MYSQKFDTDYMILDEVNENLKVIHFTGVGKTIEECKSSFITKSWI
jgi:ABC-type enterochelin transport system ATPase subunit